MRATTDRREGGKKGSPPEVDTSGGLSSIRQKLSLEWGGGLFALLRVCVFALLRVCVFALLRAFGLACYLVKGDCCCDDLYALPLNSFLVGVVAVVDLALKDEARALAYILLGKAGELWVKDCDIVPLGAIFDLRSVLLRVAALGGG